MSCCHGFIRLCRQMNNIHHLHLTIVGKADIIYSIPSTRYWPCFKSLDIRTFWAQFSISKFIDYSMYVSNLSFKRWTEGHCRGPRCRLSGQWPYIPFEGWHTQRRLSACRWCPSHPPCNKSTGGAYAVAPATRRKQRLQWPPPSGIKAAPSWSHFWG